MLRLLILLFSINICLASQNPMDILGKGLETPVNWILKNRPSEKEILKKLGTPDLVEKDTKYYALHGHKYSLAIKFQKGQLSYLSYRLPYDSKTALNDFKEIFKSSELQAYPLEGSEKETYILANLKNENIKLFFNNNSTKSLDKIIYGSP